jgi:hypothetical protein
MAVMLAMVSGVLVGVTPLLILDAAGRHRFREVSLFHCSDDYCGRGLL